MLNLLTKVAMVSSFAVFTLFFADDWGGNLLGVHNHIWEMLDLPPQPDQPPMLIVLLGLVLGAIALVCLFFAYRSVWMILSRGEKQDFRSLAKSLQQLAFGLAGFWFFSNSIYLGLRALLAQYVTTGEDVGLQWDPFNPDLVFAIVAVAILAIAKMMERAWRAEDEVQHFL